MPGRMIVMWGGPSGAGSGGAVFTVTLTPVGFALIQEIGAQLINPQFNATYTAPPVTASLNDDDGNPAQDVLGLPNPLTMPFTYQESVNGTTRTWTLTGTHATGADNDQVTATWFPRVYWDIDANPGLSTELDIESMANSNLQGDKALNQVLAPVNQYVYYAFPTAFPAALLDFQFGAFPGGFIQTVASVAVTANTPGAPVQNYQIWRSSFLQDTTVTGPQLFSVQA